MVVAILTAISLWWAALPVLAQIAIRIGIALGLGLLARALAPKPKEGGFLTGVDLGPQAGSNVPRQITIGRTGVYGQLVYHNSYGEANEYHQQIFVLSDWYSYRLIGCVIDGVEHTLNLEDEDGAVRNYTIDGLAEHEANDSDITLRFYNGWQSTADQDLIDTANPTDKWDANSKLTGLTYVIVFFKYRKESGLFKGGLPRIKFIGEYAALYDWRLDSTNGGSGSHRWDDPSTWEFTENPIVALYNYQRGFYQNDMLLLGMGVPNNKMILSTYTAAANACEESVTLDSGGTEDRYRIAITLTADRQVQFIRVLEVILSTFAGYLYDYAGSYYCQAGVSQSIVETITDDVLVLDGGITYAAKRNTKDLTNEIFGTFVDPNNQYEASGYTPQISASGVTADGEELPFTLDLLAVPSQTQAERIAKIRLLEARKQRNGKIALSFRYLHLQAGDWITWNSSRFGNYSYRIVDRQIDFARGIVALDLAEIASSVYSWSTSDEGSPVAVPVRLIPGSQPSALLGFGGIATTVDDGNGTAVPHLLFYWDEVIDETITHIEIQYKVDGADDDTAISVTDSSPFDSVHLVRDELLSPDTYVARAKFYTEPPRATSWTSWTALVKDPLWSVALYEYQYQKLGPYVQAAIEKAIDQSVGSLYEIRTVLDEKIQKLAEAMARATTGALQTEQEIINDTAVQFENSYAAITAEAVLRADGDTALASQIVTVQAGVDDNAAAILTEQTARADGDSANAADILTLTARVDTNEDDIADNAAAVVTEASARASADTAIAATVTAVEASYDEVSASALFKMESQGSGGGASARIAMYLRVSTGDAWKDSGLWIEQVSTQGRVLIKADVFGIWDGTTKKYPFVYESGVLYVENAYIRNLDANVIETNHLKALQITTPKIANNAVTQMDSTLTTGSKTVASATTVISLAMTRNSSSYLDVMGFFEIEEFSAGSFTAPYRCVVKILRNSITQVTFNIPPACIDAAGLSSNHHYGGEIIVPWVDESSVSGSYTYAIEVEMKDDLFGSPSTITINVRNRYIRLLERQK